MHMHCTSTFIKNKDEDENVELTRYYTNLKMNCATKTQTALWKTHKTVTKNI